MSDLTIYSVAARDLPGHIQFSGYIEKRVDPVFKFVVHQDDFIALEREIRSCRLELRNKISTEVAAEDVQPGDVIASLGMTISDVLLNTSGEIVLQDGEAEIEVSLPAGLLVQVIRDSGRPGSWR